MPIKAVSTGVWRQPLYWRTKAIEDTIRLMNGFSGGLLRAGDIEVGKYSLRSWNGSMKHRLQAWILLFRPQKPKKPCWRCNKNTLTGSFQNHLYIPCREGITLIFGVDVTEVWSVEDNHLIIIDNQSDWLSESPEMLFIWGKIVPLTQQPYLAESYILFFLVFSFRSASFFWL